MNLTLVAICVAILVSLALSGCTSEQVYYTGQAWQRNECNKIFDRNEYERCMNATNTPYEDYRRHTDDSQKQ